MTTTTQTTATAVTEPPATAAHVSLLSEMLRDVSSVLKTIMSASAIAPATKSDLSETLTNVQTSANQIVGDLATTTEQVIADAPSEAGALASGAIETEATSVNPVLGIVAEPVAAVAGDEAKTMLTNIMSVFDAHNKSLMADLQSLAAKA